MAVISKDLGPVSAYAVAVANGFTGTEAEWEQYIANASTAAQSAAGSATAAASSASAAAQSATAAAASQVAAAGSETEAANYALVAGNHAMAAAASATAAETAETGAETAQAAAEAAQAAAEAVAESIPEDYTELTEEVGGLKSAFDTTDKILSFDDAAAIPFTKVNPGYYIRYSTGAESASSDYCTSDYIDITMYASIYYKRVSSPLYAPTQGMAFYDANREYISGQRSTASQDHSGYMDTLYDIVPPPDAVYARFTIWQNTETYGEFELYGKSKLLNNISKIDAKTNLIGDVYPIPGNDWTHIDEFASRTGIHYTLNGALATAAVGRMFLSGDTVIIMGSTWYEGSAPNHSITMREGQVLRIELHKRGGTMQNAQETPMVLACWYWHGSITPHGDNTFTDYGNYRDISYDASHPVVYPGLYFTRNGTVYDDYQFDIIIRDISNGAQNQIYADTAPLELETATSNHSVGELIICKNRLYEVTAAIAAGETITPGTNVAETTIAAQLSALKALIANN